MTAIGPSAADPVASIDDVESVWAPEITGSSPAPIRDAIMAGQLAMMQAYQRASAYAASQSDPLRAVGEYADEIFGYERGVYRQLGELDGAYRARGLSTPSVTDPNAVVAAANAILAPYTSIQARYYEHSDECYLTDTTTLWFAPLFDNPGNAFETESYPDRRYTTITSRRPPGCAMFADPYGRIFVLRVPDISAVDGNVDALFDGTELLSADSDGFFLAGTGATSDLDISFLWDIESTVDDIYNSIINAVETIRGQSIRWELLVEPALVN